MILSPGDDLCLTIGGLAFRLRSEVLPVVFPAVDSYRSFYTGSAAGPSLVSVRVSGERMPSLEGLEKVFDSEEAWELYSGDGAFLVVFKGGRSPHSPFWTARVEAAKRRVDVFCGPEMIEERNGRRVVINPLFYPLDQILLMIFLKGGGFTTHAAGALVDGKGMIFAGVSGAGKSTVSRLLARDERFLLLSDDRVILRRVNDAVRVFGSPWPGDARVAENADGPLKAALFLARGDEGVINSLSREAALRLLLPVVSIPWYDRKLTEASLSFCDVLLREVPAFELSFSLDSPVADLLGDFAASL